MGLSRSLQILSDCVGAERTDNTAQCILVNSPVPVKRSQRKVLLQRARGTKIIVVFRRGSTLMRSFPSHTRCAVRSKLGQISPWRCVCRITWVSAYSTIPIVTFIALPIPENITSRRPSLLLSFDEW
jgi:hypothetical protein